MKTFGVLFLSLFFINTEAIAQQDSLKTDSLYLNIVIPEEDTVMYSFSRYRVAANTHPEARAFINGNEVKVYSSGAFVDIIDHEAD
ncbi:MAG: hypothetical protein ACMZ7B_04445, partial [Balneola sp.]